MSNYAIQLTTFGRHEAKKSTPTFGFVQGDRFAAFADLKGTTVRCTSGDLWVTLENDVMDHVIRVDQSYTIPLTGKVIIGGKGAYKLEQGIQMPLAS
jgi:hypothetical protein